MNGVKRTATILLCASLALTTFEATAQRATGPAPRVAPPLHAAQQRPRAIRQRPGLFRHATVELAWKSAKIRNRPLIVMFTSDSCRYCTKMMTDTYGHPAIERMLATHSETVLAHATTNQALAKQLGIRAYPTSLVVSPQGKIVASIEGYVEPQAFAQRVAPLLAPQPPKSEAPAASTRQAAAAQRTK